MFGECKNKNNSNERLLSLEVVELVNKVIEGYLPESVENIKTP